MLSYRSYALGFFILLFVAGIALFDLKGNERVLQYNPKGMTHYDLPYDLMPPTPNLFSKAYLDPIKGFRGKDVIVFIGNSVVAGAGSEDAIFLNKQFIPDFDVINAGLGGEYFTASLSLAIMGLNEASEQYPDTFFHIFIAYPPSRLYINSNKTGYYSTGPAIYALAKEGNLADKIFIGKGLNPMGGYDKVVRWIRNSVIMNMRFIINRPIVMASLYNLKPLLVEPVSTKSPLYGLKSLAINSAELDRWRNLTKEFYDEDYRNQTLDLFNERIPLLIQFLEEKKLRYKMHFLLLADPLELIEMLPSSERNYYLNIREDYVGKIRSNHPEWAVEDLRPLPASGYYDAAHMNESGQRRLASMIFDMLKRGRKSKTGIEGG